MKKRSMYASPEAFSMSPLLTLLPVRGTVSALGNMTSALYARYEAIDAELADQALTLRD